MVLERNDNLIGIDCGASKVLLQSAKINSSRTIISKGQYCKEYVYSSHPDWDPNYRPIPLDVQNFYILNEIKDNIKYFIQDNNLEKITLLITENLKKTMIEKFREIYFKIF